MFPQVSRLAIIIIGLYGYVITRYVLVNTPRVCCCV